MPKSQMFGVKEGLQRHPVLHSSLLKHVSMATNTYTTLEELLSSTESARYEAQPLSTGKHCGEFPIPSVQLLCSATASNWQWNRVQDIRTWTHWALVALSYPLFKFSTYPLLETVAKQWVCEDTADCKDLKCAAVICRLWKEVKVL
jgi:hypothetical protein